MENALVASTHGGIEAQEKRGQLAQAEKQTLPLDLREHREAFEALGFIFGSPVDNLFQSAAFPPGWKKVPTDHAMWSDIEDDKGRKRGAIFYKAAFYDQRARASLSRRFEVSRDYENESETKTTVIIKDACGEVDRRIEGLAKPNWSEGRVEAEIASQKIDAAEAELTAWLAANFPQWNDPTAHWD